MRLLGVLASSILKKITDLFNRTTSGSLGSTDTGQTWQATRGTWSANGTQATSADTASTYPLASIPFKQNVTVSATVAEGTGISFWVTDANNWYATIAYRTQSSFSCGCSTCCNTCSHTGGSCGSTTTCNTCTHSGGSCGTTQTCSSGFLCSSNCWSLGPCSGSIIGSPTSTPITCTNADCTACGSTSTPTTCTNSDCTACGSFSCGCTTCTTQNYYMRLYQSVSGTISQVISDYTVSSLPAAIKVVTSSNTITASAYSDTALTTLLGSTSTTPASPIRGSGVGIIKTPAAVTQGTTVDTFSAT